MKHFAVLLSLLLFSSAAPARIWVVDARGGGDFLDLPPAVAAANPGDTVLVVENLYNGARLTRGIELIGLRGTTSFPSLRSPLVVESLPAGERVLIRGIDQAISSATPLLHLRACSGLVQIEECSWAQFNSSLCARPPAVLVDRCRQVILHRCVGFAVVGGCTQARYTPNLRLLSSTVHLYDCQIHGAAGAWCAGEYGGLALEARSSTIVLSRTHIEGGGGSGASCLVQYCYQGRGGPAVDATGSHVRQYGSEVLGGYTGMWQCLFPSPPTRTGADWLVRPASHFIDPEPLPSMQLLRPMRLGGTVDLRIEPQSHRSQFVFASFSTSALELPGITGMLWLDPAQIFLAAVIPPGASAAPPIPLENDPLAIGVDLHLQIVDEAARLGAVTSDVLR